MRKCSSFGFSFVCVNALSFGFSFGSDRAFFAPKESIRRRNHLIRARFKRELKKKEKIISAFKFF
jgi:hypothetical protein